MNANDLRIERAAEFRPLMQLAIEVDAFASDWRHCDRIATYAARMLAHDRTDSLQYANLYSSALNELLETAFRKHGPTGELECTLLRAGVVDRIELSIPCDEQAGEYFRDAIKALEGDGRFARYVDALLSDGPLDPDIGLLELAVDYEARLSLQQRQGAVLLVAELTLDPAHPDATAELLS